MEILDAEGKSIEGFSKNEADSIQTDSVCHKVTWRGRADVSALKGESIAPRFHIVSVVCSHR